ncbi:rhodanese-like domain-containing protein [Daejeonella sp.]|uniref:rhodanese-like domain-containing protein n=1 Tax=Daejeonella sp. TaxID=2805397 RepID=UPI0030BADE24
MDISAAEFSLRYQDDTSLIVIDVREELEYQTFNVGGSNIPLGLLIQNIEDLDYEKEDEIVVICQRGLRSETARRVLAQNGYKNVRNLTGGLLAIQKLNTKTSTK